MDEWNQLFEYIPASLLPNIENMVYQLQEIEVFLGLHIVESGGFNWPGIMIPILVLITSFASSWLMQKRTFDPNAEDKVKTQQKIMLYAMPVMMAAFTFGLPAGVGIFWITSQLFQVGQDLILFKKDGIPLDLPFIKKKETDTAVPSVKK